MKRILLAAAFAATSIGFIPTQALAQVNVNVLIGTAPPPPRYEVMPAPRSGYVWAPGYWNWNGSRHVWNGGRWERNRSGSYYTRPEWRQSNDGWRLDRGGWKRGNGNGNGNGKKAYRNEEHRDQGRDDNHGGNKHKNHCPPGQAKKGNC